MSTDPLATTWESTYRRVPPVGWMTGGALLLVVIGGVYMASYAPRTAPLGVAIALMAGGVVLMLAAAVALRRARGFAWRTFRKVFKWAFLAYAISAAMIEFAFVRDHMARSPCPRPWNASHLHPIRARRIPSRRVCRLQQRSVLVRDSRCSRRLLLPRPQVPMAKP